MIPVAEIEEEEDVAVSEDELNIERKNKVEEIGLIKIKDYVEANLSHNKHLIVHSTAPFNWYLCEERLEVQVWVTFHPDDPDKQRPRHRDKLIGSAYLDLASLADSRRRHHRIR